MTDTAGVIVPWGADFGLPASGCALAQVSAHAISIKGYLLCEAMDS